MHRLERLINLVAALLDAERPLTAEDLRRQVPGYAEDRDSFRRAFERDKDALRELGIPLTLEPPDPAVPAVLGYRIPKDRYYLPDPGLADDELAALHLAATAVRLEGSEELESGGVEALWKLGGRLAGERPSPPLAALPAASQLVSLFTAVTERRRVAFTYHGRRRDVEPHRLSFRNGRWYLAGRPPGDDGVRSYRLDRFESEVTVSPESGTFERLPGDPAGPPEPWELGGDEPVEARLLVDSTQAGWAVDRLGDGAVEAWQQDGSVVVRFEVTNRDAFRSFVLGFLEHAEVLAPPELRDDLTGWLEALCR